MDFNKLPVFKSRGLAHVPAVFSVRDVENAHGQGIQKKT